MRKVTNPTNRKSYLLKILTVYAFSIGLICCGNDDDGKDANQDCGCASETLFTVPDEDSQIPIEEQTSGLLFYKGLNNSDQFFNDEKYKNRFWIFRKTVGCNICETYFIICDENLLGSSYDYLKEQNVTDSIPIRFTGERKRLCNGPGALPVAYSYSELVLNSIEQ